MRIDLHTHSTFSDGTTTPDELVAQARDAGLDVVALTDHDTIGGWAHLPTAAAAHGVDIVPGIEVSCRADGISIHLLAYLPTAQGPLHDELEHARTSRETRAQRIVQNLSADVPITYDDVLAQTSDGTTIGRPHIADALVKNGVVADRSEAFKSYLASDSKYYASHYAIDAVRAVELVRASGGVPVLAHPFAALRGRVVSDGVVHEMIDAGLFALEAYHRDHTSEQVARAVSIAKARGLDVTGSSDFHGTGKPNRLGENTTDPDVLERLLADANSDTSVIRGR